MSWPPHVTVAAIVHRNDRFLMVEELSDGQRVINQPAGHLEPNESLTDAIIREVLEETGYIVRPTYLVGLYQFQSPSEGPLFLRLCFTAEVVSKSDRDLDPDILAANWFSVSEIAERQRRSPLVDLCLQDYISGKQYPLDLYQNVQT